MCVRSIWGKLPSSGERNQRTKWSEETVYVHGLEDSVKLRHSFFTTWSNSVQLQLKFQHVILWVSTNWF